MRKTSSGNSTFDTRQRILRSSARAFATNGIANARIANIAKDAGVGRATLYQHFSGKEELLNATLEQIFDENIEMTRHLLSRTDIATAVAIRNWLRKAFNPPDSVRDLTMVLTNEISAETYRNDFNMRPKHMQAQKFIRQALRRGVKSDEFRSDLNINKTAQSLQDFFAIVVAQASLGGDISVTATDNGEAIIGLLLRGLH